jgi:hypothetical protein
MTGIEKAVSDPWAEDARSGENPGFDIAGQSLLSLIPKRTFPGRHYEISQAYPIRSQRYRPWALGHGDWSGSDDEVEVRLVRG